MKKVILVLFFSLTLTTVPTGPELDASHTHGRVKLNRSNLSLNNLNFSTSGQRSNRQPRSTPLLNSNSFSTFSLPDIQPLLLLPPFGNNTSTQNVFSTTTVNIVINATSTIALQATTTSATGGQTVITGGDASNINIASGDININATSTIQSNIVIINLQ